MTAKFSPERYARANDKSRPMNKEALKMTRFRKPTSECEQMLDIGCGTGDFTRNVLLPWSKPCRKMVAVDALPGMIEYAKANHPHPEISYEVLDAGSRDISKFLEKHGKFDRVYSFYCLHWIKDQDVAFTNVGKLLKDDGECLLLFLSQFVFYDVWQEMASMERWRDIIGDPLEIIPKSWNRDPKPSLKDVETSVKEMVEDAGMDTISCTVYPETPCVFKNAQGVLDMVLPIVTTKDTASEEEKQNMRKEMATRLINACTKTPDSCFFPMDIVILHAHNKSKV
ncbi:juvenile hormone acid O-methyltransferase isoform X2 [Ixodes scapularis]|nr:juvenile hormone acid O-methyltransferase isoform X2 [Ixodes scapularis]